ncbi:unnamed protein product [Acanthoscelides obtectus]|uniref:Uncharacterized protein n=1 Tax=Acanthoscelides obtectus TaxID=200917 RepID=A0A9P0QFX7_ACAOB|nr:unnamed protein product [Acanthoscelides obtectus]CAK1689484.1 hypothetical protein AOBTE_LOCUS37293 [Acanthoscelides obtectus]
MHQALANRDKGITPLNLANLALNPSAMVSSPPELIEKWKSKPLHGRYRTRIEDQAVDTKASQEWLKESITPQCLNTTYAQVTASGSDNTTAKKFIQELIPDIAQIIDQQKCPNTEMCTCGQPNHPGEPCNEHKKCINCEGQHAADSRECPRMKEEVAIQRVRTLEKISYLEAKRKVISSSPRVSYAQVTATPSATVNKLVEELLPLLSKTIETQIKQTFDKFVNRPVRTLTPLNLPPPNQYLSDTSTQPSLSEKRKRTVIQKDNADDPADDTDESFRHKPAEHPHLLRKKRDGRRENPESLQMIRRLVPM